MPMTDIASPEYYCRITFADGRIEYRAGKGSEVVRAIHAEGITDAKVAPRSTRDHGPMPVAGAPEPEPVKKVRRMRTYKADFGTAGVFTRKTEMEYAYASLVASGKVSFHVSYAAARTAAGAYGRIVAVEEA